MFTKYFLGDSLFSLSNRKKIDFMQKVEAPYIPPYLVQIKASNEEVNNRIEKFMARKRSEIDIQNIKEFCSVENDPEFSCARVDAVLQKRKDSKSHLQGISVIFVVIYGIIYNFIF